MGRPRSVSAGGAPSPSGSRPLRTSLRSETTIGVPHHELDARTFTMGGDEYLVFSFPIGDRRPSSFEPSLPDNLTDSERNIVSQILGGRSNVDIARSRRTSPRTVANQMTGIYRKLGVGSRRELNSMCKRGRGLP